MGSGDMSKGSKIEHIRTGGLLALVSVLILVEGTVRTDILVNTPSDQWDGDKYTFPPGVQITAAVVEVFFGLTGLFVGLGEAILGIGSPAATIATIICQCLGWFTFVVYTIAAPAFTQDRADKSLWMGLNLSQSKAITAMGILGSVSYCFILQGSQFFLAFKLLKLQTGEGHLYNAEYHRSRLVTFETFVLIGGGAQLACGIILRHALGAGRYMGPVVSPPFMVFYPELTITMGIIDIVFAVYLSFVALRFLPNNRSTGVTTAIIGAFVFVCHVALHNIAQSFGGGALIIVGSQLLGLSLTYTLFPTYLAYMLCAQDHTDSEIAPVGSV